MQTAVLGACYFILLVAVPRSQSCGILLTEKASVENMATAVVMPERTVFYVQREKGVQTQTSISGPLVIETPANW